jgi:hypothetical protein
MIRGPLVNGTVSTADDMDKTVCLANDGPLAVKALTEDVSNSTRDAATFIVTTRQVALLRRL